MKILTHTCDTSCQLLFSVAWSRSNDKAVICPHCGVSQKDDSSVSDSGSIGWGFLGCCIPIVGLILFLVWRDNKPKNAKAAGIGALISVGCSILYWVLVSCVGIGVGFLGA